MIILGVAAPGGLIGAPKIVAFPGEMPLWLPGLPALTVLYNFGAFVDNALGFRDLLLF